MRVTLTLCLISLIMSVGGCGGQTERGPTGGQPLDARFPIALDGKLGYINAAGKIVIKPQFEEASAFREGLAAASLDGLVVGFIDVKGCWVVDPRFEATHGFSGGLAPVLCGGKWGYIDKSGKTVIEPKFEEAAGFSEGLAWVQVEGKQGYIDKTGQYAVEPRFELACDTYSQGLAPVRIGKKYGYIDNAGNMVIQPRFDVAMPFTEGLAAAAREGKFGFIDKNGRFVIARQFDWASPFAEGLAPVRVAGFCGYIDKKGRSVIRPKFDAALSFSDGIAPVRGGRRWKFKWGLIDKSGSFVVEPQFDAVNSFRQGLALVEIGGKWGYINKSGNYVWKPAVLPKYEVGQIGEELSKNPLVSIVRVEERNGGGIADYGDKISADSLSIIEILRHLCPDDHYLKADTDLPSGVYDVTITRSQSQEPAPYELLKDEVERVFGLSISVQDMEVSVYELVCVSAKHPPTGLQLSADQEEESSVLIFGLFNVFYIYSINHCFSVFYSLCSASSAVGSSSTWNFCFTSFG